MVQKIVDATEKHSRRYGCEALNPLRYETGRNTQENREPVSAALKKGNSRDHTSISLLLHTSPPASLGRCYSGAIAGSLRPISALRQYTTLRVLSIRVHRTTTSRGPSTRLGYAGRQRVFSPSNQCTH